MYWPSSSSYFQLDDSMRRPGTSSTRSTRGPRPPSAPQCARNAREASGQPSPSPRVMPAARVLIRTPSELTRATKRAHPPAAVHVPLKVFRRPSSSTASGSDAERLSSALLALESACSASLLALSSASPLSCTLAVLQRVVSVDLKSALHRGAAFQAADSASLNIAVGARILAAFWVLCRLKQSSSAIFVGLWNSLPQVTRGAACPDSAMEFEPVFSSMMATGAEHNMLVAFDSWWDSARPLIANSKSGESQSRGSTTPRRDPTNILRRDVVASRAAQLFVKAMDADDDKWAVFQERHEQLRLGACAGRRMLKTEQIPWPKLTMFALQQLIDAGLESMTPGIAEEVHMRLRGLQRRWHPDRFYAMAPFYSHLSDAEVIASVTKTSQQINQIKDALQRLM